MNSITQINPNTLTPNQSFNTQDFNVIPNYTLSSSFNANKDTIEYFVYDFNNNLLQSNYNFGGWKPQYLTSAEDITSITINPEEDAITAGFTTGIVKTVYNYIAPKLSSSFEQQYYISEISSNRTEIRLNSNFLSNEEIAIAYNEFKAQLDDLNYFDEFYLNFEDNFYVLAINVLLDITTPTYSVLIKLYEPLPVNIPLKTQTYVVVKTAESTAYQIEFEDIVLNIDNVLQLKTANFNIPIKNETGPLTSYQSYTSITSTPLSGALSQLLTNLDGPNYDLSVDYEDYENFVFFSSANQRLYNFEQKVSNIENYQNQINAIYSTITGSTSQSFAVSSSKAILEKKIQDEIVSFDGYEYFLYYESSSYTWPKTNSTPPYILYSTGSSQAINWYTTQSISASTYDQNNQNNLIYVVPEFIRSDNDNTNYILFVNMVGQFYDYIWLYTKGITSKLNANSNLYEGVSKDLVADVLTSLGTKIYDSSYTLENIYNAIIGLSPSGSTLVPTGSELITSYVTASVSASALPTIEDFVKLSYKKIYHNLPYLLKKKGTVDGVRTLINIFGIPDTIIRINEFGGKDKNPNTWDQWQNEYNLAYNTSGSYFISSSWELSPAWDTLTPASIQFRFKTNGVPTNGGYYSQSLWTNNISSAIRLRYTGSGYASGSYSGSIPSSSYQYALLDLIPDTSTISTSASVYLPFFDGNWWSVMATANVDTGEFTLYAGNKVTPGGNYNEYNFLASSSVTANEAAWTDSVYSYFPATANSSLGKMFSGSYQEIRYYDTILNSSVFKDYVMNPYSTEGAGGVNSSPNELAFRAPLGGELYTGSKSIHPKVTGSWITASSFISNDSTFYISNTSSFENNYEYIYFDQVPAGIKNIVTEKITQISGELPLTSSEANVPDNQVLSPFISIQQNYPISQSYTNDINYTEVALSPQNEINEDINSQIGYFNIGNYIGDPRLVSTSAQTYPELDILSEEYFKKYTSNYNIWDYIRIIQYYDNALFKMIKDYVPARTSLATGIVIKQHLLERNKYPVPQADISTPIANVGVTGFIFDSTTTVNTSIVYPITESGVTGITITGSITEDATDSIIDIILYSPTATPIVTLWSELVGPFATSPFNGSYYGSIPSGSYIQVSGDTLSGPFQINNFTASLVSTNFTPYYTENMEITGSPIQMYTIDGGTGGTMPNLFGLTSSQYTGNNVVNITQSWSGTTPSLSGSVAFTQSSQIEFFDGELSGSILQVENGELNEDNPYKMASTQILLYNSTGSTSSEPIQGSFTWVSAIGYNGSYYSYYVQSITINETDLLGFNSEIALNNLTAGNTITFPVSASVTDTFTTQVSKYVTGTISSISAVSPNVWKINLSSNPNFEATYYDPLISYPAVSFTYGVFLSGSVSFNPYLNNFIGFNYSSYNPVINNAIISRPNDEFFDVDFSSNAITAVNKDVIISASRGSGSATPSSVPASNYTSARSANPRYNGSTTTSRTGSIDQLYVNQPMISGSSIGAVANVEDYCNWFAYFDNISPLLLAYKIYINGSQIQTITGASAVRVTSLISIDGNRIDLSPTNNIIPSSSLTGALDDKVNPLTSNIPILNSIFPSNIFSGYLGTPMGTSSMDTPVSIRQYSFSGSNVNVSSGSFQNYQVFSSGVAPDRQATGSYTFQNVFGKPNETIILLATGSFITPVGNINGLLIPGNFNPKFTGSLLSLAQSVGFFETLQ
jgi:hypothetical protein